MAIFRIQRLLPAQLIFDFPAMTAAVVACVEIWIIVVDLVWGTVFPLVYFTLSITHVTILSITGVS